MIPPLKNGASKGFAITVEQNVHTTADCAAAKPTTLIDHYNDVWRTLIMPDNLVQVKSVDTIAYEWQSY